MLPALPPTREPLGKRAYEARLSPLREALVRLQLALREAQVPVLLVIDGADGAGKGEVVNALGSWLDPRGLDTHSFSDPSDEERERPPFWRYWRALPRRGRLGVYVGSWHTDALLAAMDREERTSAFDKRLREIAAFEKTLSDDGALILKCWLHLSKEDQRVRFRALEKNPATAWRVSREDWRHHRHYALFAKLAARVFRLTHAPHAPWKVFDAADERRRDLELGGWVVRQFERHLARLRERSKAKPRRKALTPVRPRDQHLLRDVPLDRTVADESYQREKGPLLARLHDLVWEAEKQQRSIVFVFEGWDAAGKGGTIRRLTPAIDARFYRVIPVAAPSDEEKAHHYLWRFWRQLPRAGRVAIYDRSWYGRVLVERVEALAREEEWRRAYQEINDFERQLAGHGIILIKFWLHISKEEQLRRFRARQETSWKKHKINAEDWRNRRRWDDYETAICDMVALTDTPLAPWHLVPANNKRYARLQVMRHACDRLAAALK